MTFIKQLFISFVFCLLAFISYAQGGCYNYSFLKQNVQHKIGYIYTQAGAAEFQLLISKDVDIIKIAEVMATSECKVISVNEYFHRITIQASVYDIYRIIDYNYILWVEEILPLELNGSSTPAAHNGRLAHEFGYRGAGAIIGVWEGSGINEHPDIIDRYLNKTPVLSGNALSHAMAVVGIMVGNGNMDMNLPGMATEAEIVVRDFQGDIAQEMKDAIDSQNMIITQNSYSISPTADPCAIRGSYKIVSKDMDKLVRDNPYLVQVFSAGNGQSDCSANGITGFRTIPSGYQSAKNVITVGAVNSKDSVTDQSAWGPVRDGRIKPEVVALGEGVTSIGTNNNYVTDLKGTSYAAPVVSGLAAQLAARYKELNGAYPPASLIKAAICNSAIDLGQPGPDFKYGFGKVNAYNAIDCINTGRYKIDSVNHQGQVNFNIIVPANTAQLKVTLTWSDPEGDPANPKALVNDVDLGILDPNFVGYLPWVLDTSGNNKNNPATRGNERTNNIEQITIDNPAAGTHSVIVLGESIVSGYQVFSVAYETVDQEVTLNYPLGGESFEPGEEETVWWNSTGTGVYKLEYSLNDGNSWNVISSSIPANIHSYNWQVPATITANAKIRITQGALTDSSEVFNILGIPEELYAVACNGLAKLYWHKVQGATLYDVYRITNGKAEYFASTVDSSFTVTGLNNTTEYQYSVRARSNTGIKGKRTAFVKVVPSAERTEKQAFISDHYTMACKGDTPYITIESRYATNVELQIDSGDGWKALPLTNNKATFIAWAQTSARVKYTNACGDVVYSDTVETYIDSSFADITASYNLGELYVNFDPGFNKSGYTYFWSFGDGSVSNTQKPVHLYNDHGLFTVIVTVTSLFGCEAKDTFQLELKPVGINKVGEHTFHIYPNPANTYVDVEPEGGFGGEIAVSVYTILGKQVDNIEIVKLNNEICRMNTATLPEGVYVVKLLINNEIYTNKLIIER